MENSTKRKKTFLIAEAGINHNGSLSQAKELMSLAKKYEEIFNFSNHKPNLN